MRELVHRPGAALRRRRGPASNVSQLLAENQFFRMHEELGTGPGFYYLVGQSAMNWLQRHWDARAAANFMLGGAGSGLMVAALFVADPSIPVILSLVLVASGLTAVWLEIGPQAARAARVLQSVHLVDDARVVRRPAPLPARRRRALRALGAAVRRRGRGARSSTARRASCAPRRDSRVARARGRAAHRPDRARRGAGMRSCFFKQYLLLGVFSVAVIGRAIAWWRYRAAVRTSALEPAGKALVWIGTVAALALVSCRRSPASPRSPRARG